MAAAARCVRSLLRSPTNSSSRLLLRSLNSSKSVKTATSVSLRSSLKEAGVLNSSRNYSLVSKANNFTNTLRSVSSLCNISTIPPLNLDSTSGSGEGIDASGDDDGETWSNSEEGYIGDDT